MHAITGTRDDAQRLLIVLAFEDIELLIQLMQSTSVFGLLAQCDDITRQDTGTPSANYDREPAINLECSTFDAIMKARYQHDP